MAQLRITEIFYSLQGESNSVGLPTVFVRLTGCPLRCGYCDTTYAFKGGEWLELDTVMEQVAAYAPQYVCVTGGEPLAQEACLELLVALCNAGYRVSLETSGALDISRVDPRVVNVMDLKTPGSGEEEKNLFSNIDRLKPEDQVKFVICDAADYDWALEQLRAWDLGNRCQVLFSPALGLQNATELAEWILRDRLNVRFQIQLHKYLWGDVAGK
ncbi:7-carboxy-7-deazaguanine synthase QueE [Sedimenticola selenatireducens]|uniref:7-carboxy-7-deazaguanine synthase n=1 Tax=Sedimenticola selenatireducens TaxID=191960 RepID=A0A2N6CUV4_9GAMM|nr:7-carboxy-7-deazaguanine synthase QueE [Sedimenticola selenatireducens]PLX60915.1 MAG: 7-carboxy-7-deazaguanine synthase QueE [Sedimenticola selenatireducens]